MSALGGAAVDYCITTMNRPQAVERLLFSIASHQPDAPVHVADQSERFDAAGYERLGERLLEAGLRKPLTVHRLPFDCGVSAARNHLVDSTDGDYVLSLDDDFVLNERSDVDALVRILKEHPEAGMVGGAYSLDGQVRHAGTSLLREGRSLRQVASPALLEECAGVRVQRVEFLPLFVLFRRELFEWQRWDPALKTGGGDDLDFFVSMLDVPYTVLFTPDVDVEHPPVRRDASYLRLRTRIDFIERMMGKHGLDRVELISGVVLELRPDGNAVAYCELDRPREAAVGGA